MKILSHRLLDGRCRDCGHHDSFSAPDSCPRCALDRMAERGYVIELEPVRRFDRGYEMWRMVAQGLRDGTVKAGRFYIFIGHNDGGSLGLPLGDLSPEQWAVAGARIAHEVAKSLLTRYQQVWVVTNVGCWNADLPKDGPPPTGAGRRDIKEQS